MLSPKARPAKQDHGKGINGQGMFEPAEQLEESAFRVIENRVLYKGLQGSEIHQVNPELIIDNVQKYFCSDDQLSFDDEFNVDKKKQKTEQLNMLPNHWKKNWS